MLESWVLQRIPSEEYLKDKDALIEILSPVAFDIHATSPRGLIDEDTFMEKMIDVMVSEQGIDKQSAKKEAKETRRYLEEESGLFLEKGKEEGKSLYGFFHLSFQEYLAALELVDKWKKGQIDLNKYVFDSRWLEIVRLGAADLGSAAKRGRYEATEFVKAILNVEDDFEEAKRPLILAGYIVSDDVKLEPDTENRIIDDLFNEYLNTDYEELKNLISRVIKELLSSEKERVISERIKKLAKSESVRAVELLRLIEVEEALPILSTLSKSKSVEVKRAVAFAANFEIVFGDIVTDLMRDEDFITVFNSARRTVSKMELKIPKDVRTSYNFRKCSLFSALYSFNTIFNTIVDQIELVDLIKDEDNEIKEIATRINSIKPDAFIGLTTCYPSPMAISCSDDTALIIATKSNSEIAYLEFIKPMNVIDAIETIKKAELPKEDLAIITFSESIYKLVSENFEKIIENFGNDLGILLSVVEGLNRSPLLDITLDKSLKTDDPVIRLLVSYLRDEILEEGIIRECIEIFKEEKNDKNKIALFNLLYHALNPFAR
jgi:hypothetical protein